MQEEYRNPDEMQWNNEPGVAGRFEKILYRDAQSGTYCRLLKIPVSFKAKNAFNHKDFDEVVYILKGKLTNPNTKQVYSAGQFAHFEKGKDHGPFEAAEDCLCIEFRHYHE